MGFFRVLTEVIQQLLRAAATSVVALITVLVGVIVVGGLLVAGISALFGIGGFGLGWAIRRREKGD